MSKSKKWDEYMEASKAADAAWAAQEEAWKAHEVAWKAYTDASEAHKAASETLAEKRTAALGYAV